MSRDRSPEQLDLPLADEPTLDGGARPPTSSATLTEAELGAETEVVTETETEAAPGVEAEAATGAETEAAPATGAAPEIVTEAVADASSAPERPPPEPPRGAPPPPATGERSDTAAPDPLPAAAAAAAGRRWRGRPPWHWLVGAGLALAAVTVVVALALRESPTGGPDPATTPQAASAVPVIGPRAVQPRRGLVAPARVPLRARLAPGRELRIALPRSRGRFAVVFAYGPLQRRYRIYPFERGKSIAVNTAGWLPGTVELGGLRGRLRLLALVFDRPIPVTELEARLPRSWEGIPKRLRGLDPLVAWGTTVIDATR